MDRNLKLPASCPAPVKKMRKTGGADGPVRGKGGQYGAPGPPARRQPRVCLASGFTSRTGPSAPPTLRSKHALNADVGSRHRNRDRDRYRDRTSCDPIARGAARDGSKWTIPIPIAIWMRASSGQSRDRTRSREGDEAVVYVYVNGYGDEGPQKPCRSADCMALTGCMSHPQF